MGAPQNLTYTPPAAKSFTKISVALNEQLDVEAHETGGDFGFAWVTLATGDVLDVNVSVHDPESARRFADALVEAAQMVERHRAARVEVAS